MKANLQNKQYYKFCLYGFLKNLRFFEIFLLLFLIEKGISFTQIGILYAAREILINIFEIPSGFIADTYGRKNSLIASFVIYIITFITFYYAHDFWHFFLAFVLFGIGDAFRSGTHKGMIMDYLKLNKWENQKISYYGHTRSWSQRGSAISALAGGLIFLYGGQYQVIFLYSIVPYFVNLFIIASYPKELNRVVDKTTLSSKNNIQSTIKSFLDIIREPSVLKIINTSAIHTAYLKAIKDYIQPLMVNVALLIPLLSTFDQDRKSGLIIGIIYFVIYLLTASASKISSKIEDRSKSSIPNLTLLMGFIFGAICGISYYFEMWIISLVAFIAIFILENVRKPILTGYIADNVPNTILTSVLSAQSLLKTIMTASLALLLGIFADHFGIDVSFMILSSFLITFHILITYRKQNFQN